MAEQKKVKNLSPDDKKGIWRNHGIDPNFRDTARVPDGAFKFATIVYVKFTGTGLIVRTAYWETVDERGNPLSEAVVDRLVAGVVLRRFPDEIDDSIQNGPRRPHPARYQGQRPYYQNFDDFTFSKRSRIYVYLDNGNAAWFDDTWPVIFSPYSASQRSIADETQWKPVSENNSFFNARRKKLPGMAEEQMLYLENHLIAPDGTEIPDDWPGHDSSGRDLTSQYSINFNIWMKPTRGNGNPIAIVIDPDTGNGSGSPPPANP